MTHDYEAQRLGTYETFALIAKDQGLPAHAMVAFQFAAEDVEPNWSAAEKALTGAGFRPRRDAAEGILEAVAGPMALTADEVWRWEKQATDAVLKWDFWPDGWEVLQP